MDEKASSADKINEENRKKQIDAFEEQKKLRKAQMEISLKQLDAGKKITEKTIDRMKADRDVVEKVDLAEEKNEYRKKALKAKIIEMDAILEGERLKLDVIKLNRENIEKQMSELDKMQPMFGPQRPSMGSRG